MKIKKVYIKNYRNLNEVHVEFNENCNFIVGENNIGKSNFLSLFNIIFNSRSFSENDFTDLDEPIEVDLRLELDEVELGAFNDLFDPEEKNCINIRCRQESQDDFLEYFHSETGNQIKATSFRCANFLYYDSLRNPTHELNFDKGKGAGKFLSNLVKKGMNEIGGEESDYINDTQLDALILKINDSVSKIKAFKDFDITAQRPTDLQGIVSRIIQLQDNKNGSFVKTGYGVQFMALITLNILDKIQQLLDRRGDFIFTDPASGNRYISLILGLDEPEIHLHPHAQRVLIKYLYSIVDNKNEDFSYLLKNLFNLDGVIGQIILVTHSPNILLDDYSQIVRFHQIGDHLSVISGTKIKLSINSEKHLKMQHLSFKEAFFSRGVLVIEGETEQACIPKLCLKLGFDTDQEGISIISTKGGAFKTVSLLVELVELFGIPARGLADRDDIVGCSTDPKVFLTTTRDFEMELVSLVDVHKDTILYNLVKTLKGQDADVQSNKLVQYKKYFTNATCWNKNLKLCDVWMEPDKDDVKLYYYSFFSKEKSYYTGSVIGGNLPANAIPLSIKSAIMDIKNLVSPNVP